MQNSLKKIFYNFIFLISTIPLNSSEQFNFNVTEIKITEDGNKFRGEKGGVVTTDNGIIINADNFDYNKITNILKANGNVKIEDTKKEIIIYSENATYLKDQEEFLLKKTQKQFTMNL